MAQVVEFRLRSEPRLIKPGETGIVLQFPYMVMRRRLNQLLQQHLSMVTRTRRQRDERLPGDDG
jgi:hypothetical protein